MNESFEKEHEIQFRASGDSAWWAVGGCAFILVLMLGVLLVTLLVVKLLWAWTVPDLFPGAVEQGLIAKNISWLAAFKIGIFVSVLAGLSRIGKGE